MRIPKLRFKEFSGEWEEKRLGDIAKIVMGQSPSSSNYNEEYKGLPLIQGNADCNNRKIFPRMYTTEITKESFPNDIIMTVRAPVGAVSLSEIHSCIGRGVCAIRNANKYLYHYLIKLEDSWDKIAQGSTFTAINSNDIKNLIINLPSLEEQEKIGNFLSSVDKKIAIIEEKLNLFKEYKKGMMQKIFKQEIRFKDENGNNYPDWVEKRLGDIGETYNGLSGKTADDFGTGKKYITYKNVYDNTKINIKILEFVRIEENEKQNIVEYGDIFFTTSSETPEEVGYTSILLDRIEEKIYLNSFCFGYRLKNKKDFYLEFFRYVLKSKKFRDSIYILAQGSTRYNLSKTEVLKLKIALPCLEEQEKIANFLSSIDNKIENLSNELENLKDFKKGLLQKMFI